MTADAGLTQAVRRYYGERLERASACCDPPRAGSAETDGPVESPPSFGCGQPTILAELRPGETVLDLGSGAGLDALRAARAVGPAGRAIGVDMTPAMITRARRAARKLGIDNARFLEGSIEALPVADAGVDVVISNCVINLSQDKQAAFDEAYRVLRPGGRVAISDVLRNGPRLRPASIQGWCACVDGAEDAADYRDHLRRAGFAEISVEAAPESVPSGATYSGAARAVKPAIRAAEAPDLPRVAALLQRSALPTAGLTAPQVHLWLVDAPLTSGTRPQPGARRSGARRSGARQAGGPRHEALQAPAPEARSLRPPFHEAGAREPASSPHGMLPLAVVGVEAYGPAALLRALAVREDARGHGYGAALMQHASKQAVRLGASTAYALTTTVPGLLGRWGFDEVGRGEFPEALRASAELRGACPDLARAFRLRLRRAGPAAS